MQHDKNTKICEDLEEIKCLLDIEEDWKGNKLGCKCQSACSKLKYDRQADMEHKLNASSQK